jgi:hypothetical protein
MTTPLDYDGGRLSPVTPRFIPQRETGRRWPADALLIPR